MGFVGSSEGTSHNLVGRLDGPFHLSRIHLHKQSLSHPHAPVPIPPSHVHSEHSSSCPFRLVLTRALLAARVKASNDKNVGNKLKMPHCPAMQHLFEQNLFFPQSNELCLETLRIKTSRPQLATNERFGTEQGFGATQGACCFLSAIS